MLCTVFLAEEMSVRKTVIALVSKTLQKCSCHWRSRVYEPEQKVSEFLALKTRKVAGRRTSFRSSLGDVKNSASIYPAAPPRPLGPLPDKFNGFCRHQALVVPSRL